jgi:aminomethyltransferase
MLYGSDIDETTSPLEATLGWTVRWEKGEFIGREALERQRAGGVNRRLVGMLAEGRAVARHGYAILHDGRSVGAVTSGTFSPTLQRGIALGYVPRALAAAGTSLDVEVRGRAVPAQVTRLPFYRANKRGDSSQRKG